MFVSLVIPTYNRIEDLKKTLPQISEILNEKSELILYDQSDSYDPVQFSNQVRELIGNKNYKYIHSTVPSVTLAWNTAATFASGEILLFLDDDIDLISDIIDDHKSYYEKHPDIIGVAGSYYAGAMDRPWIPGSKNGNATTCAGVNMSIRTETFRSAGTVSDYIKPFAPFDWEIAEYLNQHHGGLAVGDDIFVFHRAPASGGCENQAKRGISWYYGCYFNHFLWLLSRKGFFKFSRIPRHFYWLFKYCLPSRDVLLTKDFFTRALYPSLQDAFKKHRENHGKRMSEQTVVYKVISSNSLENSKI